MRIVWTVLVGLSAVVLGANQASAACGCCGCSRGVPIIAPAPGRIVFTPAPACCQFPVAAAAAPIQGAADKKDEAKAADKDKEEASALTPAHRGIVPGRQAEPRSAASSNGHSPYQL
jgi:hypothetical protein